MSDISITNMADVAKCPFIIPEHQLIKARNRILASTGCSKDICQAGRVIHTDEPRVGENRSLEDVLMEAEDFLRILFEEDFFPDVAAFEARLQAVRKELNDSAKSGLVRGTRILKPLGGSWKQSYEELEFGVRKSWLNSRKCIARNHYQELKLCDLRSVTTSVGMAQELVQNATRAFQEGRIEPTVFVFPPRRVDERGPMIWNNQLLGFAGYKMDDGSVLGDPGNIELTTAIIELGWRPPQTRGRWDLLPLVVMAESDKPVMVEIPSPLSRLVHISHPQYPSIAELDLRWVAAPALTRLGFDIGGVQYTAAPFMGWFMDAEIGVRNLADSFRYNVLPSVVKAMGMTEGRFQNGLEDFEDLPEYEQLKMLCGAQSELTFAVKWSFNQAGVTMSDSLTASKRWCQFDDKFKEKLGYRLPADPYWIAPPQGSIIPIWHRGGSPTYQPKPMISRHVQNPIKAWVREKQRKQGKLGLTELMALRQSVAALPDLFDETSEVRHKIVQSQSDENTVCSSSSLERPPLSRSSTATLSERRTIAIYFCSAGTVAEKLANRLYKRVVSLGDHIDIDLHPHVQSLDHLQSEDITTDKILLLVVSSIGKGKVPANGSAFLRLKSQACFEGVAFAVFGNGDSRYSASYNGAADAIDEHLRNLGGHSLLGRIFRGDTAVETIPYNALNNWWTTLKQKMCELSGGGTVDDSSFLAFDDAKNPCRDNLQITDNAIDRLLDHSNELRTLKTASIVSTQPSTPPKPSQRSMLLTLDIGTERFEDMNCVQVLPLNHPSKVDRALTALHIDGADQLKISEQQYTTNSEFLSAFADLERPFKSMDWLSASDEKAGPLMMKMLSQISALETLEVLRKSNLISCFRTHEILFSADLLQPRTYSVASSNQESCTVSSSSSSSNKLSIMLKRVPDGRFSSVFLVDHRDESGPLVKYRIIDSVAGPSVRAFIQEPSKAEHQGPFILIATGAGFGAIRCIIASRIAAIKEKGACRQSGKISIFVGLHPSDVPLAKPTLQEAVELGLPEKVEIVESNDEKRRIQDVLAENADYLRTTLKERGGNLFVCTNEQAAQDIKSVIGEAVPAMWEEGENPDWYLEEIF